ncbi:hypothetical protein BJY52DRAFT_1152506 [Lactarius psammicola]|nr:hypothetical protein BJY52DRAFT_1152506 [Lactarius psammicola]
MTLLIDGYIAQTFYSRAEQYFRGLLKSHSIPSILASSGPGREGHFFLTPDSRVLDRAVVYGGTVVPQTMWSLHPVTDRRQHVEEAALQMPIFFEGVDGGLGLSLEAAAAGRCHGLRNAHEFAPLGHKSTTHIRILWPGYKDFTCQVMTRDMTSEHNPITISKFAHHIGRSVDAFLNVRPSDLLRTTPQWQIGPSGIQRSDITVIGAIHVSVGSWMPILQLGRYIL